MGVNCIWRRNLLYTDEFRLKFTIHLGSLVVKAASAKSVLFANLTAVTFGALANKLVES